MVVKNHWPTASSPPGRTQQVGQVVPSGFPPEALSFDLLALDKSGSMEDEGFQTGRSKKDLLLDAVNLFLVRKRQYRPTDMVSVTSFDHVATVWCEPVNICAGFESLVQGLNRAMSPPHGGTDMSRAFAAAQVMLERYGFLEPASPFVCRTIVLSDGHSSHSRQAADAAQNLQLHGVIIESLGLGRSPADVDESLLRECATTDADGFDHYRFLGDSESLLSTFAEVATATLAWEG